jgi:hypothetical protein
MIILNPEYFSKKKTEKWPTSAFLEGTVNGCATLRGGIPRKLDAAD